MEKLVSDIGNIHALKLKLENFKDDLKQDTELLGTTSKKTNILLNSGKFEALAETNKDLSNSIYSHIQSISDKSLADWERVRKYSISELPELKITSSKINELGKTYFQQVYNLDQIKDHLSQIPRINIEYCKEFLSA